MLLRRLGVVLFQDVAGALEKLVCCVLQDVAGAVPLLGCCDVPGPVAVCGTVHGRLSWSMNAVSFARTSGII